MKSIKILLLCAILPFFSCKKKKNKDPEQPPLVTTELRNGFPDDINLINAYFYACAKKYYYSNGSFDFNAFCALNDPARDLIGNFDHESDGSQFNFGTSGNIDVGNVKFSNLVLNKSNFGNSLSYNLHSVIYSNTPGPANWKTDGNGPFKPLNIDISRGFPVIVNTYTNTSQSYTCSISNGHLVNLGNVSNYDSLVVSLNSSFVTVKKRLTAGATSVFFSNSDMAGIQNFSSGYLNIYAYNYSTKMVENVNYLFELSNKLQVQVQFFQ